MDPVSQVSGQGGTQPGTPGQDDGARETHTDGASFWQSHGDFLQTMQARFGGGSPFQGQPQQAQQPHPQAGGDDYQDYIRWKEARAKKDPRALLEIAGMQPGDVLNATLFGGPTPQQPPPPDPVETLRGELTEIRQAIESERKERQTVAEKISEAKAKANFHEQVKSMQDLTLVQKWGQEAADTAWNIFIQDTEEAFRARAEGRQANPPSLREAAIKVENYLRQQASRLGDVIGAQGVKLEPLQFAPQSAPNQAATPPTNQERDGRAMSPTLTNAGGETGARPPAATTRDELRKRALEAAKRMRGQ